MYTKGEVERIMLAEGLCPTVGDVIDVHIDSEVTARHAGGVVECSLRSETRPGIVVEYKGVHTIGMNSTSFSYDVVLKYLVLVGLEKQEVTTTVNVTEEMMRSKLP